MLSIKTAAAYFHITPNHIQTHTLLWVCWHVYTFVSCSMTHRRAVLKTGSRPVSGSVPAWTRFGHIPPIADAESSGLLPWEWYLGVSEFPCQGQVRMLPLFCPLLTLLSATGHCTNTDLSFVIIWSVPVGSKTTIMLLNLSPQPIMLFIIQFKKKKGRKINMRVSVLWWKLSWKLPRELKHKLDG